MDESVPLYRVVALLEDLPAIEFQSRQPLVLRRGQVGTVVHAHNEHVSEVEFSDNDGRTFALKAIPHVKLMVLHYAPELAAQ